MDGAKIRMGQLYSATERREIYTTPRKVFETYRAEFDAPPQLDPVEIKVAIGLQGEIDLVVYERL